MGSLDVWNNMPPLWGSIRWVGELLPRWRPAGAGMPERFASMVQNTRRALFFSDSSEPRRGDILV